MPAQSGAQYSEVPLAVALGLAAVFFLKRSPEVPIILPQLPTDVKVDRHQRHLRVALIHLDWRATFGCWK
jgi:hypothetical protein